MLPALRAIGFRHILPIVQLTVFLALSFAAATKEQAIPQSEDVIGWDIRTDSRELGAEEFRDAINLPAYLFPALIFSDEKVGFYLLYGIGVVILWYFFGFWLDGVFELRPIREVRLPGFRRKFVTWVAFLLLGGVTLIAFSFLVEDQGQIYDPGPYSVVLWPGFAAYLLASRLRKWHRLARGVSSQ